MLKYREPRSFIWRRNLYKLDGTVYKLRDLNFRDFEGKILKKLEVP